MRLNFYGGARMVTGSNFLLEAGNKKILIDCGLVQGSKICERDNFEPFAYKPSDISAVFVTHAHIDHTGRLPKLVKEGFGGKIYSTAPTKDSAELLLLDSEHILSEEAAQFKLPPLYSADDVSRTMAFWETAAYHQTVNIGDSKVTFYDAGHILGSAFIVVESENKKIVFSGDLGNYPAPIIRPTEMIGEADYCLIESTYGGRTHEDRGGGKDILEDVIEDAVSAGGALMIPAFAMERTQLLLYRLNELVENKRIPPVPIFLDSPLAIKLTAVYKKYPEYYSGEARKLIASGDEIFDFKNLHLSLTTEQSKAINDAPNPKVIIAGSGMSHGGRILHHERRYLSDPKSTLLFIGYQASGSLGRRILDGAEAVKIFGEEIAVRCKIRALGAYSAHADQPRLLNWLKPMRASLKKVFVVLGEPDQSEALVQKIGDELAISAEMPEPGFSVEL